MSVVVPRAAKVAGAAAGLEELAVASVAALSGEGVSLVVVPAATVAGAAGSEELALALSSVEEALWFNSDIMVDHFLFFSLEDFFFFGFSLAPQAI